MNTVSNGRSLVRYSTGAIAFHWLLALLIAFNYAAAWYAEDLPKAQQAQVMGNHKAIGITILLLTVLRILWRIAHRPPPYLASLRPWELALARFTHAAFYVLMIGVPLAGWLMVSAWSGGQPVGFFGLFEFPGLPLSADRAGADIAHEVHEILANVMLYLAGLHVIGALKHQWFDRDGSMSRILPWGR